MARKNSQTPWLHGASGWWCTTLGGKRKKLHRDYRVACRKLKALISQRKRELSGGRDWLDSAFAVLADEYLAGYEKPRPRRRTRIITPEEFQSLLRRAGINFRRILISLRLTGCRPVEVRKLIWEWVDLNRALWILPDHKTVTQQREPRPRIIPLPKPILKLCEFLARKPHEPTDHVFLNNLGQSYTKNCFVRKMDRLRKRAGIGGT